MSRAGVHRAEESAGKAGRHHAEGGDASRAAVYAALDLGTNNCRLLMARPSRDGLSATAFPSGIRAIPVEICETVAPILIRRKELRPGSGGAGRHRGGDGQTVEVSTIDGSPFELFAVFDRIDKIGRAHV